MGVATAVSEDPVPMNETEGSSHEDNQTSLPNDGNHTSTSNSSKPEEFSNGSAGLTEESAASDISHESPTQPPPIQVMERPHVFDPSRIPLNIFNKPPTPTEWSLASNDSLFSIRVGNNSFNRDHAAVVKNLTKNGSQRTNSGELPSASELIVFSPPPPIVIPSTRNQSANPTAEKQKTNERTSETDKDGCVLSSLKFQEITENALIDVTIKDAIKATTKAQLGPMRQTPVVSREPTSTSNPSDVRGNRTVSVRKKSSWPSCCCSSCSRSLCCCTWPKCKFRCPSCNCKCPSCGCKCPSCDCKCPSCDYNCPSCFFRCPSCDCKTSCDFKCPTCDCKCPTCDFRCPTCKFGCPTCDFSCPSCKFACPSCNFKCPSCKFACSSCKFGCPSCCCCSPSCKFGCPSCCCCSPSCKFGCPSCSCCSTSCKFGCPSCFCCSPSFKFGCPSCCCCSPSKLCSNCSWSWCCNWNCGWTRCWCPPFNFFSKGARTRNQKPNVKELENKHSSRMTRKPARCWFRRFYCWSWCSIPHCHCC